MKFSSLRSAIPADVCARAAMAIWPLHETSLSRNMTYAPAPKNVLLVAVEAYRKEICWRGWIDLAEWLQHVAPDLASLAYGVDPLSMMKSPENQDNVMRMFEASDNPIRMPIFELSYKVLRISSQPEKCQDGRRILSIMTPQGRVWFRDYPNIDPPVGSEISLSMRQISIAISFSLGGSVASYRLMKNLRRGDVVLIVSEKFTIASANKVIGHFSINVNGEISMHTMNPNEINDENNFSEYSEISVAETLNAIPLRLDFILQRRLMTIAQLDSLYQGQVLQLDHQSEKNIEIAINGVCIAKGELVEFNGQLGVEVRDISVGKHLEEIHSVQ
jgi:type III secretion protein Q